MSIPAEQELVKHYTAALNTDTVVGNPSKVFYTIDGAEESTDLSPQLQGQGIGVYVNNPTSAKLWCEIYAQHKIYGEYHRVFIHKFSIEPGESTGGAAGFGLLRKGVEIHVYPESALSESANATVAVVPSNG